MISRVLILLLSFLIAHLGRAADLVALPSTEPSRERPRVGLVLSGGGARGAAHIGVLQVLEELRVPIDAIAGTSMGALVGGAYASGLSVAQMHERIGSIRTASILNDDPPRREWSETRKHDEQANFLGPEFGVRTDGLNLPKGAVSGIGLDALLREFVQARNVVHFDGLPIRFRAVATDIETGHMVVLDSGSVASAMRASLSIPGLFAPAQVGGRLLVDGGLSRNLPVDVVRQMGVDVVIAVNLGTPLMRRDQISSVLAVSGQVINILTEQNVRTSLAELGPADILISPELGNFSAIDFDHMRDTVEIGVTAARRMTAALQSLSLSPAQYASYRERQQRETFGATGTIGEIRFAGLQRVNPQVLRASMTTQVGKPLDRATLDSDLIRIHGRGDFDHVGYELLREQDKQVLVIQAQEREIGPDYLRFGLGLSADFSGNAYFQARASLRRTWANALGAQWRTDLLLGRVNQLQSEFYQPLRVDQTAFVAPYVDIEQKPFDIYDGGSRVARFLRQSGSLGLDVGAQWTPLGELRLGLYRGARSYKLDTGSTALLTGDSAIAIGGARLRWRSDQLDSSLFPRSGYSASLDLVASVPALGARDRYSRWEADYLSAYSRGEDTVQLAAHAGGALGSSRLPAYDLFPLGGFLRMSGYQSGELLGESLVFGRAVYMRRFVRNTLLKGLFGGVSLEAGRVNRPVLAGGTSGTLSAGSIFLTSDSPVGPVYLGLGFARGGRRALYLYLGAP